MNKIANKNWKYYNYNLENKIISKDEITNSLNNFWNDVFSKCKETQEILIIFKIKDVNFQYKTISNVLSINTNELRIITNIFIELWDLKNEEYHNIEVSSIVFYYKILSEELNIEMNNFKTTAISNEKCAGWHKNKNKNKNNYKKSINKYKLMGYNLPASMDITMWGNFHLYNNYNNAIVFKLNSQIEYHVTLYSNYQKVNLIIGDKTLLSFTDTMLDKDNLLSFERRINNQKYVFNEGVLVYKEILRKVPFLKKIEPSLYISKEILTMDLETRTINNVMEPYCISIFDGKKISSFYLEEFENSSEMLNTAIISIMKRKYNGYRVYLHNFSKFDGIFLLKILTNLSDEIKPIIRDNNLIDIRFKYASYTIYFRDSLLLLPMSLSKLAKSFNVENKGIFPYSFVNNKDSLLNYEGKVPDFEYFQDLTKDDYLDYCNLYKNKSWNLKKETINYCNQDVISLYQILIKFIELIFMEFRLNVIKYPTLSSLAFAIYRKEYLNDYKIPLITGIMLNDIKQSYTGGSVDVYNPYGEQLYHYDVNSLYPYVMKILPMPVGNPYYFEGDILSIYNKPFGFFEVEVLAPKNLNVPLLQTKYLTNSGFRTVAPVGKWRGMYFSEEIYKAMDYGYKFKIIRGYIFEKEIIFKEYVNKLYEWKVNSNKKSLNYIVAKLLLNSLYGRFGMNEFVKQHAFISEEEFINYYKKYDIQDVIEIENGKELISYIDKSDNDKDEYKVLNISVPISSAITSYGRIVMFDYKTIPDNKLYYCDTDSVVLSKPLSEELVGPEIGKMKLEHESKKSIHLSPKVYGIQTVNDEEIVKIKGAKSKVSFNELESLLNKNEQLIIVHEKWYKDISKGNINIKNEIYKLKVTDNKRMLIYDKKNKFIDTSPLTLE